MNEYGRTHDILRPVTGDLFHFAPVPLVYRELDLPDLEELNAALIAEARATYSGPVLEVPDRRHVEDLGQAPEFSDDLWSETQVTPVGIWHRVPTNNFLDVQAECVKRLRSIIEERYLFALTATGSVDSTDGLEPWVSESWIQFYKNSDDKVLHNHERYGPPYPEYPWSGAYYLHDGDPDPTMPYAGVFSFHVRRANYFIRPKAGLLMLWPADILHEVHPFYGAKERIVINFNINTRHRAA
jgi:hypothetical protein